MITICRFVNQVLKNCELIGARGIYPNCLLNVESTKVHENLSKDTEMSLLTLETQTVGDMHRS